MKFLLLVIIHICFSNIPNNYLFDSSYEQRDQYENLLDNSIVDIEYLNNRIFLSTSSGLGFSESDGLNFNWKAWYEPYARDNYWKGPEIGIDTNSEFKTSFNLNAGTYYIKVFNEDNSGHYSLAVGEAEFFGSNIWEKIITWTPILLYISPYMDIVHWKKFDIRAYIPHIMIIVLLFILYFIFRKIFFKKLIK